ncbi:MAG: ATP-binding protein [Holophaga sp.]|nr:ATP-binding protein [Holophaga sp.]
MRLKNLSLFLTSAVIVLTAISLSTTLMYYNFSQARKSSSQSLIIAIRACERLREGSDILTSAVRAYAATGEERYKTAFQTELLQTRSRDQAMAELRTLGLTPDEVERFESAKRNSDALVVEVENHILAAADRKDFHTALTLAYGEKYQRFKDAVMVPTRNAQNDLETRLTAEGTRYSEMADQVRIVVFFAYALNLITVVLGLGWYIQRRVIGPVATLTDKTQRLLAGDNGVDFSPQVDQTEIGDLARALEDFRKAEAEMERQRWIKNGLMGIVAGAQEADNLNDFARLMLKHLAPLVEAGAAAMFYRDLTTETLIFLGGYGLDSGMGQPQTSAGLLAEVLEQKQLVLMRNIPEGHLRIVSGLGDSQPRVLVLVPILKGDRVAAVIELACLADPDDQQRRLLNELPRTIAPHLELVLRTRRTHQLLAATQSQALELEKKGAELGAANKQLNAIFEAASSGIVLLQGHLIVSCNRMADETFGYAPGELLGRSIRCWYTDDGSYETMNAEFESSLARGETFFRELQLVRKGGEQFWGRLSAQALDRIDLPKGLVVLVNDVTAELENKDKLKRAVAAAEAANQAKSAFLANMSHEIRTPMNAVLGYTQLLQRDPNLSEQHREYVATISRSGSHLLNLINDVLEMSKIEAGRITLGIKDFDFRLMLSDLASMFMVRMDEKGIAFSLQIQEGVPRGLRTDPMKVMQVLINVIGNAVKFTDQGAVTVRVQMQGAETPQGELEVVAEVIDTGIGIPERDLARIFDAFEQAEAGVNKGGTGLGMAISRKYAQLLGGDLTVASREGEGSTFRFHFRCRRAEGSVLPSRSLLREVKGLAPGSLVPHLLVVDDIASNRDLIRSLLEPFGFQLSEAANGKECLERLETTHPDLILMDWVMPVMNGLEATRRIRAVEAWRDIPILMLAARALEEIAASPQEAGVDGYLRKPVQVPDLLEEIRKLVPGVCLEYADGPRPPEPVAVPSGRRPKGNAARLPAPLRQELTELVEGGEIDRFMERVGRDVESLDPGLAHRLALLTEQFDYRQILEVLG